MSDRVCICELLAPAYVSAGAITPFYAGNDPPMPNGRSNDWSRSLHSKALPAVCRWLAASAAGVLTNLPWIDERMVPAPWIGLTLWILLTMGLPPFLAFRYWLGGGLAGLAVPYYWLPAMAATHLDVSQATGFMVAALAVTWDAFRFGVYGYFLAVLQRSRSRSILLWPVVWVALECIWPHVFPWRLGHTQIGCLPLCQIAEFAGVFGVSFLVMWGSACAAELWRSGFWQTTCERNLSRHVAVYGITVLTCLCWGSWRIQNIERMCDSTRHLRVALVQPGSMAGGPEVLCALSKQIGDVDLIVWGESSAHVGFSYSDRQPAFRQAGGATTCSASPCPELDSPLLFGGVSPARDVTVMGACRNTAFLMDSHGQVSGRYHKRVLMPWGEYAVGQQWIPGLQRLLGERQQMVAGTSAAPLGLPDGTRLGVLICYEDLRADTVRQTVREGAQVLINLNNLTSFGRSRALLQHQQIARFRAIEYRRSLVRCGINGSTALIAPTGEVEKQATPHTAAVLIANVPLMEQDTLYTHREAALVISLIIVTTLLCVASRGLSRSGPAFGVTAEVWPAMCRRKSTRFHSIRSR